MKESNAAELMAQRQRMGWSVSYLAERLGVDVRTVRRWEAGANTVPLDAMERLRRWYREAWDEANELVEQREGYALELCLLRATDQSRLDEAQRINATLHMAATIAEANGVPVVWSVRDL